MTPAPFATMAELIERYDVFLIDQLAFSGTATVSTKARRRP